MADTKYTHDLAIKWGSKVFHVPADVWQNEEVPSDLRSELEQLIERGAILASVSQTGEGIGAACYLVDLSSIRSDE